MHLLPLDLVVNVAEDVDIDRVAKRNFVVGIRFYLPSLLVVVLLLAQAVPATTVPPPVKDAAEAALRSRVEGTVFEPGAVDLAPAATGMTISTEA